MSTYDQDPPFIEESADIAALRNHIACLPNFKEQSGQIALGFTALVFTIHNMYKHTEYSTLVRRSTVVQEAQVFSTNLTASVEILGWSQNTSRHAFRVLKKILSETAIDPNFISRLSISKQQSFNKSDPIHYLPARFQKMEPIHPARLKIHNWVSLLTTKTKNRSPTSIRVILYFMLNTCLPHLGVDVEIFSGQSEDVPDLTKEIVDNLCGNSTKKAGWLKIIYTTLLEKEIDPKLLTNLTSNVANGINEHIDDGSDKHRIPAPELDLIYQESSKNLLYELFFMLMATTGMRVGGLVAIKLTDVANVNAQDIEIKASGKTIEKGHKWFQFMLNNRVKELIFKWIQTRRPAVDSPYLFPGRGKTGHVTTAHVRTIFNGVCSRAGLEGPHLHPHSLRHSYAHILLESGNDVNTVSKLLGHANTSTTEAFYLKENAVEVAARANIPWLDKSTATPNPIPKFLSTNTGQQDVIDRNERRRKKTTTRLVRFTE
jgi:hypothetical protein